MGEENRKEDVKEERKDLFLTLGERQLNTGEGGLHRLYICSSGGDEVSLNCVGLTRSLWSRASLGP